jgi:hypothetical protein
MAKLYVFKNKSTILTFKVVVIYGRKEDRIGKGGSQKLILFEMFCFLAWVQIYERPFYI